MANPSAAIAHVVKLVITLFCMQFVDNSFSIQILEKGWAIRAFQILLIHSVLGIIRYGGVNSTKKIRTYYELLTSIIEVFPVACFTTEVLLQHEVPQVLCFLCFILSLSPSIIELSSPRIKDRTAFNKYIDAIFGLQAAFMTLICVLNQNYSGLSLAVSYIFARYVSEDFCDLRDVPYVDMSQYSLSFIELFAIATIKDF
ncbi:uncharacterized protein LOC106660154 [Trichogramma pretiosum]|uniref:uncharacterized protein LOC106660154 n=1 Tax=Trichogramma pretiosum TaxID=7493 RepID=UPI0006C96070|nr:uncharacterized protein LOC106660154 [Trichogramma pretiosum]XP_014238500.1 uncharacterized protein LOC106660154 [Trichogramma pretiosum]